MLNAEMVKITIHLTSCRNRMQRTRNGRESSSVSVSIALAETIGGLGLSCELRVRVFNLKLSTRTLNSKLLPPLLLELLHHSIQIRIPRAKFPREPIPAALRNLLAVRNHLELTSFPRRKDGLNPQALLDEGHETRDLDLVVLSRGAVHDFHFHAVPQSAAWILDQTLTGTGCPGNVK
jgi:hypothetical protein